MNTFDSVFFNELAKMDALVKLNEYNSALMPSGDGFRLCVSELHAAGISSSPRAWGCFPHTTLILSRDHFIS